MNQKMSDTKKNKLRNLFKKHPSSTVHYVFFCFALVFSLVNGPSSFAYVDEVKPALERFSGYKPMWFLIGSEHTKFQISFKATIVDDVPLYFTYTQTSFWDIFKKSAPFLDTSYSPETFYRITLAQDHQTWLDVGAQHESNGRDQDASRAWNRIYIRYSTYERFEKAHLSWSAQAWVPFVSHDRSQDLIRYRGLYEIVVTWSDFFRSGFEKDDLTFRLYPGGTSWVNPLNGAQELTLRLKDSERKFLPLFVFQIFHGYGENLLKYSDETWVARIGIGF
jgi:phospholipase A1